MFIVQRISPGRIVDTNTQLSQEVLRNVVAAGYGGVVRYVPLPGNNPDQDIDAQELGAILDARLGLLLVQHVRRAPWDPAGHSGTLDAQNAVEFARAAGYLPGAHIFVDLEGIAGSAESTKRFAEEWAATIANAGYLAGCYVGFAVPLTPEHLYELHQINSYWSDAGPRKVAKRGFAIKQHQPEIKLGGVRFDQDTVQEDDLGETPFWMVKSDEAIA